MPLKIQELVVQVKVHENRSKEQQVATSKQAANFLEDESLKGNLLDDFVATLTERGER